MKLIRITTVPISLKLLLQNQIRFMKQNGFEVTMISADGKERNEAIQQEDVPHVIIPFTRQITPLQDLICLWKLYQFFKKEKPQIVHTHTPKAGLLGMMAAKFTGVPIRLHTVAGMPLLSTIGIKRKILEWCEIVTYKCANEIYPNAESLKKFIVENNFCELSKIKILGKGSSNGINLQRFSKNNLSEKRLTEIKTAIDFNENNFYLIAVGRIVKDKGIVELINAFNVLQKTNSNLKLLLLGDFEDELDPLPIDTKNEIENHKAIIKINWTNEVEYYFALANLMIHASHREGFPNVLLQAGAMNCPIICSNIPGNIDIIEHEKTGLLFEQKNENDLMEKIEFAIANLKKMKGMSDNLNIEIKKFYNVEFIHQEILRTYQRLIAAHNL